MAKTILAFLNLGDDTYISAEKVKKSDNQTKNKVISYLERMIKKNEEEIEIAKRTVEFIQK